MRIHKNGDCQFELASTAYVDYLNPAVALRYMIEWEGVGDTELELYWACVRDLATHFRLDNPSAERPANMSPSELSAMYGAIMSPYAELTLLDVQSYLESGEIPMIPLCEADV